VKTVVFLIIAFIVLMVIPTLMIMAFRAWVIRRKNPDLNRLLRWWFISRGLW